MPTLPTLTVAQLIELLQRMPQDLPVAVEGCDCTADCVGVSEEAWTEGMLVLLRREESSIYAVSPIQTL